MTEQIESDICFDILDSLKDYVVKCEHWTIDRANLTGMPNPVLSIRSYFKEVTINVLISDQGIVTIVAKWDGHNSYYYYPLTDKMCMLNCRGRLASLLI